LALTQFPSGGMVGWWLTNRRRLPCSRDQTAQQVEMFSEGNAEPSPFSTCKATESHHSFQGKVQILSLLLRLKAVPLGNKCHGLVCAHRVDGSFMCSETLRKWSLIIIWFMKAKKKKNQQKTTLDWAVKFHRTNTNPNQGLLYDSFLYTWCPQGAILLHLNKIKVCSSTSCSDCSSRNRAFWVAMISSLVGGPIGSMNSEAQLLELESTPPKTRMLHQSEICTHTLQIIHPFCCKALI